MRARAVITLFLLFAVLAKGEVRVAFFPFQSKVDGDAFYHIAISVGDAWLNAEPYYGVRMVRQLTEISPVPAVILHNPKLRALEVEEVAHLIGLPFDSNYEWASERRFYCSKLVAKLLGIPPRAMSFHDRRWQKPKNLENGALGISPDEIFEELYENRGFRVESSIKCDRSLQNGR